MTTPVAHMSHVTIDERTRFQMQEAIREIQIIAGLDTTRPTQDQPQRPVTIGVTSPDYGDGKSTISIALASSLAHDFGQAVTLVDADLHTQSIAREYGLTSEPGLGELLTGEVDLPRALYPLAGTPVQVLPAGKPKADPARLARSEKIGPVLDDLRSKNANVVLDLPAVLHSMNAPALAQRCDGVVVVVRHGRTTREQLDRTLHLLRDANVIGIVINRHRTSIPGWAQRTLGLRR